MWVQKYNFFFYAKKGKKEGDKEKGYFFFNFTCTSGKKEREKLQ